MVNEVEKIVDNDDVGIEVEKEFEKKEEVNEVEKMGDN